MIKSYKYNGPRGGNHTVYSKARKKLGIMAFGDIVELEETEVARDRRFVEQVKPVVSELDVTNNDVNTKESISKPEAKPTTRRRVRRKQEKKEPVGSDTGTESTE